MVRFKNINKPLSKSAKTRKQNALKREKTKKTVAKVVSTPQKPLEKPKEKSPKNSRSITEKPLKFAFPKVRFSRTIGLHAINILALIGLLLIGIGLSRYLEQAELMQQQKNQLEIQLTKWESLAQKYSGFRDLYLNIAILAYEVRDFKKSREYVDKALEIDPNYLPALKLKGDLLTR